MDFVRDDVRDFIDIKGCLKANNCMLSCAQYSFMKLFKPTGRELYKTIDTPTSLPKFSAFQLPVNLIAPNPYLSSLSQRKVSRLILGNLIELKFFLSFHWKQYVQ